ncbi:MAG TPA: M20/M25/M40 family metallo-hydrolase [Thermoleophilaceae bacterium]
MSATVAPRASAAERQRVVADLVHLCEVESPSRRERAMADAVAAMLREAGIEAAEDRTRAETGSDAGNLLARIPGPPGARTIMLCTHLDTVPLEAPVNVVERDGVLTNENDAILGADNKAAVAVVLAIARRFAAEPPPVGIELVFTTCEEPGLLGAKAFDVSSLSADLGFVFDHASPIGELVVAAPSYYRVDASFRGQSAHAGIRPEDGRNAIASAARAVAALELGRLDAETTANVGTIEGGTARNVVAERCRVELEARSLDHDRASDVVRRMVDSLTESASDCECDLELGVEEVSRAYRIPRSAPVVEVAAAALSGLGIEPRPIATGGGSDAHVFQARGLSCLNVANGTVANHQPDERVSVEALETMLDVTLGIVAHSA